LVPSPWEVAYFVVQDYKDESAVEALAQLFIDPRMDMLPKWLVGDAVDKRLEFIFDFTDSSPTALIDTGVQFAFDFGELGFCEELQDAPLYDQLGWKYDAKKGGRSNQIGHFLTAARLGYDPSFLDNPVARWLLGIPKDEDTSIAAIKLIVGHELVGDPESDLNVEGYAQQYAAVTQKHIEWFLAAVEADRDGRIADREAFLEAIFSSVGYDPHNPFGDPEAGIPAWQQGNSMQDLRLSVKGYRFGQEVQDGRIGTRYEAADWLRRELAGAK
jgi:hypothetical protein